MNKMVGMAEFKANCLKLIAEMQKDGVPITVTKRGKPVAEVKPSIAPERRPLAFGMARGQQYRFDDPFSPAVPDEDIDAASRPA